MQTTTAEEYYKTTIAPANLDSISENVRDFIQLNKKLDRRVVLVTVIDEFFNCL